MEVGKKASREASKAMATRRRSSLDEEKSAGIPRIGLRSRSFYVLTLYIPEDIDIYLGLACTERSP